MAGVMLLAGAGLRAQTVVVGDAAGLLREVGRLQAGATLLLQPGTYAVPSVVLRGLVGRPDAWITIRGHAGRTTIVGTAAQNVVDVTDCAFVRLEDLAITCSGAHGAIDGVKFAFGTTSHDVTLDGCVLHDLTGNGVGSQAALLDRLTLQHCEIARTDASGVYLGYDAPLRLATNTTIRDCWIHHVARVASPHYGIQIKGGSHGARIEGNVLHDVPAVNAAAIAVYWVDPAGGAPPARWNVVRGNAIVRCGSEGVFAVNGAVVEDNVLVDVPTGIVVNSYGGKAVDTLRIAHNTVVRSANIGLYLGDFHRATASCSVVNNAILASSAGAQALRAAMSTGAATVRGNACFGVVYGSGLGAPAVLPSNGLAADFVRADAALPAEQLDLTPRSGGALQDRVDGALGAPRDFLGGLRPRGAGADAGAIEAGGGAASPLAGGFLPRAGALSPAVQAIDTRLGGSARFALAADAPAGTWALLFPSLRGPSTSGPLPVVQDVLTMLPFTGGGALVFPLHAVPLDARGRATFTMRVPPLVLSHLVCVYHGAALVPPQGAPWVHTNVVRTVLE